MKKRFVSALMVGAMSLGLVTIAAPRPAHAASEKTWRLLTYGAAAATAYGVVKKNTTIGLIGAAGTALSYSKWKKAVKDRHKREGRYSYRRR